MHSVWSGQNLFPTGAMIRWEPGEVVAVSLDTTLVLSFFSSCSSPFHPSRVLLSRGVSSLEKSCESRETDLREGSSRWLYAEHQLSITAGSDAWIWLLLAVRLDRSILYQLNGRGVSRLGADSTSENVSKRESEILLVRSVRFRESRAWKI